MLFKNSVGRMMEQNLTIQSIIRANQKVWNWAPRYVFLFWLRFSNSRKFFSIERKKNIFASYWLQCYVTCNFYHAHKNVRKRIKYILQARQRKRRRSKKTSTFGTMFRWKKKLVLREMKELNFVWHIKVEQISYLMYINNVFMKNLLFRTSFLAKKTVLRFIKIATWVTHYTRSAFPSIWKESW